MKWIEFRDNFFQKRDYIKQVWRQLTDEDLMYVQGNWARMVDALCERYGWSVAVAEQQLRDAGI